ncbi:MAG: dienelactone hydrolase family protein [Actinomycetes bacterium]
MTTNSADGAHGRAQNVSFPGGDGEAYGYLELPPSGRGPGLVVVQEWWGLTDHIADLVRRFAAEGFVALAPDLYGGRTTHDPEEARRLLRQLPVDRAARDLAGAVDLLLGHDAVTSPAVGAVGFCMGGGFALALAAQQGERVGGVVPFYGLPPADTGYGHLRAQVQGHYAEKDRSISRDDVAAMTTKVRQQAEIDAEIFWYPAGHAFVNDQRPSYDPDSARLAWSRAVAFLRRSLGR